MYIHADKTLIYIKLSLIIVINEIETHKTTG